MERDDRRDEGQFYAYGKRVMPIPSQGDGDVKHSDFAGVQSLPEHFTDEDVRTKLNTVINALKGASAALAILLGATAYGADITVQTAPKGVIYNNQEIVTNVIWSADGLATTNDVANALDRADAAQAAADAAQTTATNALARADAAQAAADAAQTTATNALDRADVAQAAADAAQTTATNALDHADAALAAMAEKRIALFLVDINDATNGVYCGFELKASTNNFSHAVTEDVRLQFYSQSEIADTGIAGTAGNSLGVDRMLLFTGTSIGTEDVRAWTRVTNTVEWTGKPMRLAALVDVSCLRRHPEEDGAWLSDRNEELVWCYLRDRALSPPYELEAGTSQSLWRPIQPTRWYSSMPAWATGD